jgi:GxxExxY protein
MEPQINADERRSEEKPEYLHEELTKRIIGVFYEVYNELGHGFLESVYHNAMVLALRQAGLMVESKVPVPVWFRGQQVGAFEVDILVERKVLLELKAVRALESAHEAQTLNYLRATPIEVGLLLNFGPKPQVRRFAFSNTRKRQCPPAT